MLPETSLTRNDVAIAIYTFRTLDPDFRVALLSGLHARVLKRARTESDGLRTEIQSVPLHICEARVQVLWAHVGQETPWGLLWEEDPVDRRHCRLSENFPSNNRAMG